VPINSIPDNAFASATLAIFVISTTGNGQFPKNADNFSSRLSMSSVNLSNLRFAELALGSSYYKQYCLAGDTIYKILTEHGAEPLIPYAKSDRAAPD
jgi:sulfite reductase (NADPH) flavoprotein alpha-component